MARFATLSLGASVLDRLLALVLAVAMSAAFGIGKSVDAYLLAIAGPTLLMNLVGDLLYSLLLPEFMADHSATGVRDHHWAVVAWTAIALLGLTLIYAAAWAGIVTVAYPGADGGRLLVLGTLTSLLILFGGLAAMAATVLIANGRYLTASLRIPLASAVTLATFGVWVHFQHDVLALAVGAVTGAMAAALVTSARALALLRPASAQPRSVGALALAVRLARASLPLIVTGVVTQATIPVERLVGFGLGAGTVSSLNYGRVLVSPPLLVGQSISTASFPRFIQLSTADPSALEGSLARSIGLVVFLLLPMSVTVALLAEPLVTLVYRHGAFDQQGVVRTTVIGAIIAASLVPSAVSGVTTRFLYAVRAANAVAVVSTVTLAAYCLAAVVLGHLLGYAGLALASTLASFGLTAGLLTAVRPSGARRWGHLPLGSLLRSGAAGLAMAAAIAVVGVIPRSPGLVPELTFAALAGILGVAAYLATAYLVRSAELRECSKVALRALRAHFRRS